MRQHLLASAAGLVLAAGLALTGCSEQAQGGPGPMKMGSTDGGSYRACAPDTGSTSHKIVLGDFFTIDGDAHAQIENVTFVHGKNLSIDEAFLIPIQKNDVGYGSANYPPTQPIWAHREPLKGTVVQPGERMNVVFVASRPDRSEDGKAQAIQVRYTVNGTTYTKRNSTSYIIGNVCK